MKMQTHLMPRRHAKRDGGLAVLLRGGAFRGSPSDTLAERIEAQAECARSLELHVLRPYVEAGVRAEVFATVYDADYCTSEYDGTALWRPYSKSLRAVTIISADAAEQLSATAASLYTFLRHCREHGDRFDAVVMTRYDLRFKSSIASLLGPDLTKFSGIRFLWRELGSSWRNVWSPTPWDVKRADEKQKAAWAKRVGLLKAARDRTFRHFLWRRTHRTPDTFHAFSFEYAQCFEKAIHQEMASFWPPNTSAIVRAEAEARRRGAAGSASKERLALLQRLKEAARMKPGVPASELNISLSPLFPWIHWMHRMLPQLAEAMGVDAEDDEWRANKTKLSHGLGFLLPEGSWASNPCGGGTCNLNPVYELMPRNKWIVDAGICQKADDFQFDKTSRTTCCPSPDYCCPNSIGDCSRRGAVLFKASKVSDASLLNGWRRHFYSRVRTRGPETICNASGWNGGAAWPVCSWAMDAESVRRVREVWSNAASQPPMLEDDDDTRTWNGHGAPAASEKVRCPLRRA